MSYQSPANQSPARKIDFKLDMSFESGSKLDRNSPTGRNPSGNPKLLFKNIEAANNSYAKIASSNASKN